MRRSIVPLAGGLLLASLPARAETLTDALALAYRTNPGLHAQQATQRATDEAEVQARAGWRPTVSIGVNAAYVSAPSSGDFVDGAYTYNDGEALLNVSQPLYTGGRVRNAVRAAGDRVLAGQQGLRLQEARTFQSVITAYMDVLRDSDILAVRIADLDTLQRQVRDTAARFDLGAGPTRTDVAQAEAQRDGAEAARADAEAALVASRAAYHAIVGTPPGELVQPGTLLGLPATLADAVALADAANPALAQSRRTEEASGADIDTARSAAFPTVTLSGSVGGIGALSPFHGRETVAEETGLVSITQPLVTGGLVASQVRQARARNEADQQAVEVAARQAAQDTETEWARVQAGLSAIRANSHQVASDSTALKGYQLEYADGLRSTLDVLIADENLRGAQVALVIANHDTVVAEAALLASIGRLEARWLLPGQPAYDAVANYRRVRDRGAVPWEGAVAALDHGG